MTSEKGRPRALKRLGLLAGVVVVALALEMLWHPLGFFVLDRLYDNVPQYSGCDAYVTPERAQQAIDGFPRPPGIDAMVVLRCDDKAGIEFQYGTHTLRAQLEEGLRTRGAWRTGKGWMLDGIPVELRNV